MHNIKEIIYDITPLLITLTTSLCTYLPIICEIYGYKKYVNIIEVIKPSILVEKPIIPWYNPKNEKSVMIEKIVISKNVIIIVNFY